MLCLGEDEDIVKVDDHNSFVDNFFEDLIHETLEGCWRIGESKEHDCGFEEAAVGTECCFVLIALLDPDIVVSPPHVKFGEELGVLGGVNELLNQGKWVLVLDCPLIEASVILDRAQGAILLLNKEERGCHRGLGWSDAAVLQVLIQELFQRFLLGAAKGVDLAI